MSCCCGGDGVAGGAGGSGQAIDVRTTKFDPLLTGVGDSLNYTGKASTLWVGQDPVESQQTDLTDSLKNAAWWGQVVVVVAVTAGAVWVVHRMFKKG